MTARVLLASGDDTSLAALHQLLASAGHEVVQASDSTDAERRRLSFYFSLGTQNQDPRGLAADGEATLLVSGYHAAAGVVDLFYLMTRSRWVMAEAELDAHVPRPGALMRRLARRLSAAL